MKRKYFYSGVLLLALSVLLLLPVGIAQAKYTITLPAGEITLNISGGYTATFALTDVTGDLYVKINGKIPGYQFGYNAEMLYYNVKTIAFYGVGESIGASSKSWNIGTSEGSNDIGTIRFKGSASTNRIDYTLTADTTFYITETIDEKPSIGEKPSIDEKPSTTSKTLSIQSKGGTITGTQTTTSNEEG